MIESADEWMAANDLSPGTQVLLSVGGWVSLGWIVRHVWDTAETDRAESEPYK